MCPLLPIWISKNICKNTKPCEFTFVKNKELLALFLQQILRTLKMLKLQKPKNIQSLRWILLVLIKTRTELPSCEAIDVKKVSIGNIVLPGNKFKAGTNLGLLPTWISLKLVLNSKPALITNLEPTSNCALTSKLEKVLKVVASSKCLL